MKKSLVVIVFILAFICTISLGSVTVLAGVSPYQEIYFADEPDDYETEVGNEFHHDVLKFEGNLGGTFDGAWLEYDSFSFGTVGAVAIKVNYCNNSGRCASDSQLEVWIDAMSTEDGGTKVGTVDLPATGSDWQTYVDTEVNLDTVVTGDHDIFMVLVGSTSTNTPFISNMMFFEFVKGEGEEPTEEPTPTPEETVAPTEAPTEEPTEEPTETPKATTAAPKPTTQAPTQAPSQTQDTTTDAVQDGGNTGAIIAIVVVAVVVIAAAVVSFVVLKKKKG